MLFRSYFCKHTSVNFKNVGQGDSIIIEWDDKIGIIDCNIYKDSNPVLEYISQKDIEEIEFIILSHFHFDHFSGFPKLFDYCRDNKIKIKYFFHTIADYVLQIYDRILVTKKIENGAMDFFNSLESDRKSVV